MAVAEAMQYRLADLMPGVRVDAVRKAGHHVNPHLFAAVQRNRAVAALCGVTCAGIRAFQTLLPVRAARYKLSRVAQGRVKDTESRQVVAIRALALPALTAGELGLDDVPIHHGNIPVDGFKGVDGNEIPRLANFGGRRLWLGLLLVAFAFLAVPFASARTLALTLGRTHLSGDPIIPRHAHTPILHSPYIDTHTRHLTHALPRGENKETRTHAHPRAPRHNKPAVQLLVSVLCAPVLSVRAFAPLWSR